MHGVVLGANHHSNWYTVLSILDKYKATHRNVGKCDPSCIEYHHIFCLYILHAGLERPFAATAILLTFDMSTGDMVLHG